MPVANDETFLSFLAEWFDPLPQLTRQYRLKYFEDSNEAEMVDVKTKRLFLKRSPCPDSTSLKDFRVGAKIVLYGRELTLADYGDEGTRSRLAPSLVSSLVHAWTRQMLHYGLALTHKTPCPAAQLHAWFAPY